MLLSPVLNSRLSWKKIYRSLFNFSCDCWLTLYNLFLFFFLPHIILFLMQANLNLFYLSLLHFVSLVRSVVINFYLSPSFFLLHCYPSIFFFISFLHIYKHNIPFWIFPFLFSLLSFLFTLFILHFVALLFSSFS